MEDVRYGSESGGSADLAPHKDGSQAPHRPKKTPIEGSAPGSNPMEQTRNQYSGRSEDKRQSYDLLGDGDEDAIISAEKRSKQR